jgi:hypothetical protein
VLLAALWLVFASGCDRSPTAPKAVAPAAPTIPATPVEVADYLAWCWRSLSPSDYRQLFADNFKFQFAIGDTAGNPYILSPWSRDDELLCAAHLFRDGTPSQPPATSVTLDFTQPPNDAPDPRPGMDPRWHRIITEEVNLRVFLPNRAYEVRGAEYFFVVRGDSAQIPVDLIADGVKADSTRWWLELWVDGSGSSALTAAFKIADPRAKILPNHTNTWGQLKAIYR